MFPVSLDNFNYLLLAATVYYVFLFAKAFILAFLSLQKSVVPYRYAQTAMNSLSFNSGKIENRTVL